MDHFDNLADSRLLAGCLYCGGAAETRDHVPSKVFLDDPPPTNLPVVGACSDCNNSFSLDEAYVACLIEAAVHGTTDPESMRRQKVADILRQKPLLRARLDAAKKVAAGDTWFAPEVARVRKMILKLARGHAGYELSEPCRDEAIHVEFCPLLVLSEEQRTAFEEPHFPEIWPEVGSRAMQRMVVIQPTATGPDGRIELPGFIVQDWLDVQENRYSYLAIQDRSEVRVRIVIGGYLAGEVIWAR